MDNIVIRRACLEDLYEIQKLNNELFNLELKNYDSSLKEYWPISKEGEKYFKEKIEKDIVLVACLEEDVVGYLAGTLNAQFSYNNNLQAEIDNMCLREEFRHLGIGKRLFEEFRKICVYNEVDEIKVTASYKNENAKSFYKEMGFTETEVTLKHNLKNN